MLRKVFERDLDTLEQLPFHFGKNGIIEMYSGEVFSAYLYGLNHLNGQLELIDSFNSADYDIAIRFKKTSDGNVFLEYLLHGNEQHELVPEDTNILTSDYIKFVLTANTEVTVRYYER